MDVVSAFVPTVPSQNVHRHGASSLRGSVATLAAPPAITTGSTGVLNIATGSFMVALVSGALAQRKTRNAARTTSTLRAFESELGVTLPVGYWDPLAMSTDGDVESFRRRRQAEIKNGRVAMIASIGYILPEYVRWPGECSPSLSLKFQNIPSGLAALYKIPAEGWAQIGIFVGFLELFPLQQEASRAPGDFPTCGKFGIPWFFVAGKYKQTYSSEEAGIVNVMDPVVNQRSLNAEINNGRLAMVAIVGMVMQNAFIGTTGPDMWIP